MAAEAPSEGPAWTSRLASILIVIALLALLPVPLLVDRYSDGLRRDLDTRIRPARDAIDDLELSLARIGATIRAYQLTGSPAAAERYWQIRATEAQHLERIESLLRSSDPRIAADAARLEASVADWHGPHEALLAGRITGEEFTRMSEPGEPRYEQILRLADELDRELAAEADAIEARIVTAERIGGAVTIGLALLAFVAALLVLGVQQRLRALARRLERSAREERALRRAAMALGKPERVDRVLRTIAASAIQATNADGAFVERIEPSEQELRVVSSAGEPTPPLGTGTSYEGSFAEAAFRRGRPELVPDLARAGRPLPGTLDRRCAGCSALIVPLAEGGEAFGALCLVRKAGNRPFDRGDLARSEVFGNLASLAFRKAKSLEDSERARLEVERVMESRARLVRGFSHDVKNPLSAADGYLQLLELGIRGDLAQAQLDGIRRSRRSIGAALNLIEDLVELARAEAGQIALHTSQVDMRRLIEEAADEYRAAAESANLRFELDLAGPVPTIETDYARVRQVLGNLIGNAVKYTPPGGRVTVRARRCEAAERPPPREPVGYWPADRASAERAQASGVDQLCIDVIDTGPGIPHALQESIFEEFIRLTTDNVRGAGLGLPISRRLARLLGGDVTVASEPGRGSTFTLRLPIRADTARREAA